MPAESLIERYRNAALALLPPGRALSRILDANPVKLLEGLAVEWARVQEDMDTLERNCNPAEAVEYLDVWESALALPGPCVTSQGSITERQGAVVTKLRGRTSHAQAAYQATAEALGYTDLSFVRFAPFEVGVSAVGDAVYSDEWMNVVRVYVAVSDQTADDSLVCTFVDELRRSHGFVDVILEGPMGAERSATTYMNPSTQTSSPLAADGVLGSLAGITISYGGFMSIQCTIDNGAGGNPSDAPNGVWELYSSADGQNYTKVSAADTELAKIAAVGSTKVDAIAILNGVPGTNVKVRYKRTSGGGGDSRVRMQIATW
jgi:uncharacterized protein YmfQ (DUF2313 family)